MATAIISRWVRLLQNGLQVACLFETGGVVVVGQNREMDRMNGVKNTMTTGAASRSDQIDPAFLRTGCLAIDHLPSR
jgi:hypothetical protein